MRYIYIYIYNYLLGKLFYFYIYFASLEEGAQKLPNFLCILLAIRIKINIYYGQTAGQTKYTKKPDSISKKKNYYFFSNPLNIICKILYSKQIKICLKRINHSRNLSSMLDTILESQLLNFWSTTISLFFQNGMPFQVARWLAWRLTTIHGKCFYHNLILINLTLLHADLHWFFNNDSQETLLP